MGLYRGAQGDVLATTSRNASTQVVRKRINEKGYVKEKLTPVFWTHQWRPILFTLCVDDFGVKYVGKQHADHLMQVLSEHYTILHDWMGAKYLGIDLK